MKTPLSVSLGVNVPSRRTKRLEGCSTLLLTIVIRKDSNVPDSKIVVLVLLVKRFS